MFLPFYVFVYRHQNFAGITPRVWVLCIASPCLAKPRLAMPSLAMPRRATPRPAAPKLLPTHRMGSGFELLRHAETCRAPPCRAAPCPALPRPDFRPLARKGGGSARIWTTLHRYAVPGYAEPSPATLPRTVADARWVWPDRAMLRRSGPSLVLLHSSMTCCA